MTLESVLVVGGQGQLARDFARLLPAAQAPGRAELSITDTQAVGAALDRWRTQVVLNCAAYNGVDRAESEPEVAMEVNGAAPGRLAAECERRGIRLVHFSTNYVFDGTAERPYTEADEPTPQGAYARSKRAGEVAVLAACPSALVVRSSGLYGRDGSAAKGGSFVERILARAAAREPLRVVDDQRLNPTSTHELAAATLPLVEQGLTGVVHLVAGGCCSWWEFAVEALRLSGDDVQVARVATAELAAAAPRPANGCLESLRVDPLPDWRDGLARFLSSRG